MAIMAVLLLGGCAYVIDYGASIYETFFEEEEERDSDELIREGNEYLEKGDFESATDTFQELKDKYPYSKYAISAELKMADALYQKKNLDEAFDAYDEFESLHPKNKNTPYVIYQKGMCYFRQISAVDRDQTNTLKAREEFERLVKRFPRDDNANKARKRIRTCLIYLAEYELYVGHYYFKMGNYRAALDRYSYIIKNYPDMGQYNEAMEYIRKCKENLSEESSKEKRSNASGILQKLNPFK